MNSGLKVYNQNKVLTIDDTYRGIALKRIIKATDLQTREDVLCFIKPYEGFTTGNLKTRAVSTVADEFRMVAIGPVDKLDERNIQIIKKNKELLLAYRDEADIEGISIYTYGYYTPKQSSNCGLQVYNSDGKLVFDSNQVPLLLHASTISENYYDNSTYITDTDYDATTKAIMISPDVEVLGINGEPFDTFMQFYVHRGNQRSVRLYAAWPSGLTASSVRNASITHMLVDTKYHTR